MGNSGQEKGAAIIDALHSDDAAAPVWTDVGDYIAKVREDPVAAAGMDAARPHVRAAILVMLYEKIGEATNAGLELAAEGVRGPRRLRQGARLSP